MASPQEARVPGPRRERVDRAVAEIDRFIANLKSELGVLVQTSTPTTKRTAQSSVLHPSNFGMSAPGLTGKAACIDALGWHAPPPAAAV